MLTQAMSGCKALAENNIHTPHTTSLSSQIKRLSEFICAPAEIEKEMKNDFICEKSHDNVMKTSVI